MGLFTKDIQTLDDLTSDAICSNTSMLAEVLSRNGNYGDRVGSSN